MSIASVSYFLTVIKNKKSTLFIVLSKKAILYCLKIDTERLESMNVKHVSNHIK